MKLRIITFMFALSWANYCETNDMTPLVKSTPIPELPKDYMFTMEISENSGNKPANSSFVRIYRSSIQDKALITEITEDSLTWIYFDFLRNEKIILLTSPSGQSLCNAYPLDPDESWLYENNTAKDLKKYSILRPEWLFRLGEDSFEYEFSIRNESIQRGIHVHTWAGAISADSQENIFILHQWSDRSKWTPAFSYNGTFDYSVPVYVSLDYTVGQESHHREISIFNFQGNDPPKSAFRVPDGVYCKSIKDKDIPKLPKFYSFQIEAVLDDFEKIVFYQKHYYDSVLNLTRVDVRFVDLPSYPMFSLIEDFKTGGFYIINQENDTCIIGTIGEMTEVKPTTNGQYVIADPLKYLTHIKDSAKFAYYDDNVDRAINASVYKNQNISGDFVTVNEWWFTSIIVEVAESKDEREVPLKYMQFKKNTKTGSKSFQQWNIFNFNSDEPSIFNYDITPCFKGKDRKDFMLALDKRYDLLGLKSINKFKYNILTALLQTCNVSSLRISRIELEIDGDKTIVLFSMLEPPANDLISEIPTFEAIAFLNYTIKDSNFTVIAPDNKNTTLKGVKDSLYNIEDIETYHCGHRKVPSSNSEPGLFYSPGSMAALGILMTVVGLVLGGLGTIYFFSRRL